MLFEVRHALFQRRQIFDDQLVLLAPSVHLERAHRGDDDDDRGFQAGHAALDIEELFGAQVRPETRLRDEVVRKLQSQSCGLDAVAAVRDVREGTAVNERGNPFEGLHKIRLDRILEQQRHGAGGSDIACRHRTPVVFEADDDPADAFLEVHEIQREAQNRHDFRGDRDVEAALPGDAVGLAAQSDNDMPQRPFVEVHDAAPCDPSRIEAEFVSLVQVIVDHRGEQIVRRGDRVEVSREVEVDVFHRNDLGIAASGRSALDAEARTE